MKLNFQQLKAIEDVATAAVNSLPTLPPSARATRLRGIALIFTLIGRHGPAQYAKDTADLLQELHRAEVQLHSNLNGGLQ